MPRITPEALFQSYEAYLRARVQEMENIGFGGVSFRQAIADHQHMEADYIRQMKADREAETAAFKAKLAEIDKAQPPRRLR